MMPTDAKDSDKNQVLEFCKNTFSWGDYIKEIWNFWMKEGNFFVIRKNNLPIAICHASLPSDLSQVWIEGIRVNPSFRRQGYAKKLIKHCENVGKKFQAKKSYMLIETTNSNSIYLAK